ncbi:hypothetical protein E2K93_16875 [Thalassotalea sp. HSM 43]|uniref:cation:proton antiporter n=1 Tax=Thalassotalea sp. HSM 43 TaxID=2552945 RepID=UPI00107FFE00|nr:cation:proton antiporter [Thalassotalea sp. HSM 43]QBY05933.1 hypothetical protein E2K93_16875 [Thalassotalea sp. HSM 43]
MKDLSALPLTILGGMLLLSLVISPIANRFKIPRVSLFILCGLCIGYLSPAGVHSLAQEWFISISNVTLLIISYLLGTRLTRDYVSHYAKAASISTFVITFCTFFIVCLGLILIGFSLELAAIMAAIAIATDPAATLDVIKESKVENQFTKVLEGIVALDDAIALIVFSVVLSIVSTLLIPTDITPPIVHLLRELIGAILLGIIVGAMLVVLLNMKKHVKRQNKSVLVESLGLIFLTGGLALTFEFSFLLSAMVMGIVVVNFADDSIDHFHELEFIESPLLVLFFILAGASVSWKIEQNVVWLVVSYIVLRIAGRFISGYLIPRNTIASPSQQLLGIALLPQAGIALGMALVASHHFPQHANTIISTTIAVTIFFEVVGPFFTGYAINRIKRDS